MEIGYTAKLEEGTKLTPADDVVDYAWFKLDDLPEMAFEVNYMGIEALKSKNS